MYMLRISGLTCASVRLLLRGLTLWRYDGRHCDIVTGSWLQVVDLSAVGANCCVELWC